MAEILLGVQLMHLCLMLDVFNPILTTTVLEVKDLPPFVVFSLLFPCVGKLKIVGIMQAVSRAMECYLQRRKLGAVNSGGCLSCSRKSKPPPTLCDWSDEMCRALTRFTAHEVWQLLEHFSLPPKVVAGWQITLRPLTSFLENHFFIILRSSSS